MEALLRQSRSMCPFLQKTSPATLRSLSTSTKHASTGGGTMSKLQVLANRCPVMGKAMAVQTSKVGMSKLSGVFGGTRAYRSKAGLHTSGFRQATVAADVLRRRENGKLLISTVSQCLIHCVRPSNASCMSSAANQESRVCHGWPEACCSHCCKVRLRWLL